MWYLLDTTFNRVAAPDMRVGSRLGPTPLAAEHHILDRSLSAHTPATRHLRGSEQ